MQKVLQSLRSSALWKIFGFRTLKTALGAALAVFIARSINLDYAVNAGIIVILSVQRTRRKSLDLAVMRIGSTILALAIGSIVFSLVGFSAIAFGIYLLLFIPSAVKLKFHDGIVPCSVLVSHLLASRSVAPAMLANEMMQMFIGAGIGFVLNYFMPSLEKQLAEDVAKVDALMGGVLKNMADCLRTPGTALSEPLFADLETALKDGYARALNDAENRMARDKTRQIRHMEVRDRQFEIMRYMRRYFNRLRLCCAHNHMTADLTEEIATHFNERVIPEGVLEKFRKSRAVFKTMPLPATREEFETRATLFEYLNDLEHLLSVQDMSAASVAMPASPPAAPLASIGPAGPAAPDAT